MIKKVLTVAACGMLCSLGINDATAIGKNNKETIAKSQNSDIASFGAFLREKFEQIEKILNNNAYKKMYKTQLGTIKKYTKALQQVEDQKKEASIEKALQGLPPFPVEILQIPEILRHAKTILSVVGERDRSQMINVESKIDELCSVLVNAIGQNDPKSIEYTNESNQKMRMQNTMLPQSGAIQQAAPVTQQRRL